MRALLASAADASVGSLDELRAALGNIADQLAAGTVTAAVPKVGDTTFDPDHVADVIVDTLGAGADDQLRAMVLGTVLAGDQRDAVIDAAAVVVGESASAVAERLRAEPTIDVTALEAEQAQRPWPTSSPRSTRCVRWPAGSARGRPPPARCSPSAVPSRSSPSTAAGAPSPLGGSPAP